MRFRATLAGLLTVLLLSFSFASPACETQCDLMSGGSSCHGRSHQAQSSADQQMPPMAGMDDAMTKASTTATDAGVAFVSSPCSHHMCVQQPVLLNLDGYAMAHRMPVFESVATVAAPMKPNVSSGWLIARDSPHIRSSSSALTSILRV